MHETSPGEDTTTGNVPAGTRNGDVGKQSERKWYEIFKAAPDIIRHTVNLVLALISIWVVHLALVYFLGKDAKFFDWIPIQYVTDLADIVIISKFIWHIIRNFND